MKELFRRPVSGPLLSGENIRFNIFLIGQTFRCLATLCPWVALGFNFQITNLMDSFFFIIYQHTFKGAKNVHSLFLRKQ